MLRGLFPRLFGQFREGAFIIGQFTVSNSGATLTPTANSYVGLTATGDTGAYTVTLAGGARKLTVVGQPHVTADSEANRRDVDVVSVTASTGAVVLQTVNPGTEAVAPAVADLVDTSILTIHLYADK